MGYVLDQVKLQFPNPDPVLDTVPRQTIFSSIAPATGTILSYGVTIAGVRQSWGYTEAQVGQEFEVPVECSYQASRNTHTRIDLTVWRPDGTSFSANDDDVWPYASPGEIIHFLISGRFGEAFDINQEGTWEAELTYIAV